MKTNKSLLALVIASSLAGVGCSSGDGSSDPGTNPGTNPGTGGGTGATSGTINLTNDNIYRLASGFPGTYVGNGESIGATASDVHNIVLDVEPGTLILGDVQEALTVTRGSKININGTSVDPVVMGSITWFDNYSAGTAYADTDYDGTNDIGANGLGEWAGLALMGFASSNEGADVIAEGGIGNYGGSNDSDDSGNISYVVIRGAGNDLDGNGNELNGLTLFGTGSGTSIEYVQVHRGLDDGIEHFGSKDHISHFVLTDNRDDSFDWGQGYTGSAQFGLIKQSSGTTGDRMIEADNDKANPVAVPISSPTLANLTMLSGTGVQSKDGKASEGALLRRGTGVKFFNSVISQVKAKECIEVDGDATFIKVAAGTTGAVTGQNAEGLAVNMILNCNTKDGSDDLDADSESGAFNVADVNTWFDSSANNVRGASDLGFNADAATTVPVAATVDMQDANFSLTTAMGGTLAANFVETDYMGAFPQDSASNWTDGWTINVNGNVTVWEPATGGTLAGAAPTGDGSCPTGTTFVETVDLPNSAGQMDVCQLQRRYDGTDF